MRDERVRTMVEIALSVALAAVLSLWKIQLPTNFAGGSISFAMLPIFVVALRRGVAAGVITGALFGVVDYFIEPWFVHPAQVALDYGIAFAGVGLSGVSSRSVNASLEAGLPLQATARMVPGLLLGTAARFGASFLSGIVFFAANAPQGQPVWLYSLIYQLQYLLPSALICSVLTFVIVPVLYRAVPTAHIAKAA